MCRRLRAARRFEIGPIMRYVRIMSSRPVSLD
jgi:hypothetical protein